MKKLQFVFTLILSLLVFSANAAVKINHWQTATGARVYFVENHDLPIVDVSVSFPAGSSRDTAATSGLAGITRYMMTLGAAGMDEEVITNLRILERNSVVILIWIKQALSYAL